MIHLGEYLSWTRIKAGFIIYVVMNYQDKLSVLYSRRKIDGTVKRLAQDISRDYHDKNPVLISILKGSFIFMADLVRRLDFPLEVEFVRLSSYGKCTESSGKIEATQALVCDVKDRDVIIVEDIVDSGLTIKYMLDTLKEKKAASIKVCALTGKPSRCTVPVDIDYLGFNVPDKFLVGYGLDCDGKYRNLPDICYIENEK
ncbi:MAG: hypoxanthine phosphoribosyltransferase [Dehalococcoidales bacterium]|nr:hypoxanthine phosphoribosyltransferase [Dehalococcoidales bacterium]